ncbi:hypothetical protein Tco_0753668 [Tanacetum coccineum]
MGDNNPIRTLGDYSKPSHEGYRNTIELPAGNNVAPLRSDTIRLVQNGCSFHRLQSEDLNQHLKDFHKLVDSLDLDGENRERTRLRSYYPIPCLIPSIGKDRKTLQRYPDVPTTSRRIFIRSMDLFQGLTPKVPHHGIDLWPQVQIFYDHVDCTTQKSINYAAGGSLRKIRPNEAWDAIEWLAQYENEGWNNAFTLDMVYFNYENPNVEQLLGIMERKFNTLMKDAISLMGKSESIFRLTTNEMCRSPTEPSRQEEFEHIVINFIYNQEERIRQLEHYMQDITNEFMEFSSEFALRLKEKIKENSAKHNFLENLEKKSFPTPASHLCVRDVWLIPSNLSQP